MSTVLFAACAIGFLAAILMMLYSFAISDMIGLLLGYLHQRRISIKVAALISATLTVGQLVYILLMGNGSNEWQLLILQLPILIAAVASGLLTSKLAPSSQS